MMPAARKEIAIGMNISSLNAVFQRIFSVSTASTRPSPVSSAGANTTQIALLRMARSVAGSWNIAV